MNFDASLGALTLMSIPLVLLMFTTIISEFKANESVPGSHQRWLWGGIYRAGLVGGVGANLICVVINIFVGYIWVAPFNALLVVLYVRDWHKWTKKNSDDDFWNSLGGKLKKLRRRIASAFAGSGRAIAPVRN